MTDFLDEDGCWKSVGYRFLYLYFNVLYSSYTEEGASDISRNSVVEEASEMEVKRESSN